MSTKGDDIIILGGQKFPISGMAAGSARSEFETGIKVGKASYDNREDAFYLVLEDFTGGFGSKHLDIRTELGTYWFADPANAPETAFTGRVTLPLRQQFFTITDGPGTYDKEVNVNHPAIEWNNGYIFGLGSAVYRLGALGDNPAKKYNDSAVCISVISAADPTEGTTRLYAAFNAGGTGGTPKVSFDNGQTWAQISSKYVNTTLSIVPGQVGDLLAQDIVYSYQSGVLIDYILGSWSHESGSDPNNFAVVPQFTYRVYPAAYPLAFHIPPGKSVSSGVKTPVEDLFFWNHKVMGQFDGTKITYLVPGSGDGLILYAIPPGNYITSVEYVQVSSFESGGEIEYLLDVFSAELAADPANYAFVPTIVPIRGWVANGATQYGYPGGLKVFLTRGEEPWTHLIEGDKQLTAALDIPRDLRFIGVGDSSWGEPALYLRGGSKLYVLDIFARGIYPIEVGINKPLLSGRVSQGSMVVTDGWNVKSWSPQGNTSRDISFPKKWGIPPNLIQDGVEYQIIDIIPNDDEILALAVDATNNHTILFRQNGVGWHQVGARMDDFFAQYGFKVTFPLAGSIFTGREQAIIIPGRKANGTYGYWQFDLPKITHQPTVGVDTFGDSGAKLYTGWIDGGFFDIDGTLLRLNIDAFFHHSSHQIKVEYRLDNDTTDEADATWTQCVDAIGDPDVFDSTTQVLYFDGDPSPTGVKFRTVQFKITFIRGTDATLAPELRALTMTYLKTPGLRTAWQFKIDVNRMVEKNKNEDEDDFFIDGVAPTPETVWEKLRELWTHEHTLLTLQAPNVFDGTLYVKLTEIPLSIDDFRLETTAKGSVSIAMLEPISAV